MASSYISDFIKDLDELRKLRRGWKKHLVSAFKAGKKKGENFGLTALSAYLHFLENRRTEESLSTTTAKSERESAQQCSIKLFSLPPFL